MEKEPYEAFERNLLRDAVVLHWHFRSSSSERSSCLVGILNVSCHSQPRHIQKFKKWFTVSARRLFWRAVGLMIDVTKGQVDAWESSVVAHGCAFD